MLTLDILNTLEAGALEFSKTTDPKPQPKAKQPKLTSQQKALMEKADKIKVILSSNFPSEKRHGIGFIVANLLGVDPSMLGLEIPDREPGDDEVKFRCEADSKFRAVVMINNPNHHDYSLGKPVFCRGRQNGLFWEIKNGNLYEGNHAPTEHLKGYKRYWRWATSDEIKAECAKARAALK